MNLRLVIRQPWELGYGIKRIVDDADFEVPLSQAGWVGEMRVNLPRPDFDFVRLGDEIEVRDEKGNILWAGKIVFLNYSSKSNTFSLSALGLMEYLYDLPVDAQFPDIGSDWDAGKVWEKSCVLARIHSSRINHSGLGAVENSLDRKLDFRGRTLGDVYRSILNANIDIIITPEMNDYGIIKPKISLRSEEVHKISRDSFSDWELEYDARKIVNRLLAMERDEQRKNILQDCSFEDFHSLSWEVFGSGPNGSLPYGALVKRRSPVIENTYLHLFSHATVLYVYIPRQNPAGFVQIQTRNPLSFTRRGIDGSPISWQIRVWCYSLSSVGSIQVFVGNTAGIAVNLQEGWNNYSWSFSFNADIQAKVAFRIIGTTSADVSVDLDHAEVVSSEANASPAPPLLVGATDSQIIADGAFYSSARISRVLRVEKISSNQYEISTYGSPFGSSLLGMEVEIWDYWYILRWKGVINSVLDPNTIRVTITENLSGFDPYIGTTIRVLRNPSTGEGTSECFYGVRYGTEVLSGTQEKRAYLRTYSQPEIRFVGSLVGYPKLILPDGQLEVLGFFGQRSVFPLPIFENLLTVKAGEVVVQKISAGSRELTLRGLMRKIQKQTKEYVQAR